MRSVVFAVALLLIAPMAAADSLSLPCSPKNAFGQSFGATKIKGSVQTEMMNGASFTPSELLPPFKYYEALTTQKSKKVWGARGVASFPTKDEAAAFAAKLESQFRSGLSTTEVRKTRLGVTEIYTGTGGFKDTIGGEERFYHTDGIVVEIDPSSADVMVTCKDLKLEMKQVEEAMGR